MNCDSAHTHLWIIVNRLLYFFDGKGSRQGCRYNGVSEVFYLHFQVAIIVRMFLVCLER